MLQTLRSVVSLCGELRAPMSKSDLQQCREEEGGRGREGERIPSSSAWKTELRGTEPEISSTRPLSGVQPPETLRQHCFNSVALFFLQRLQIRSCSLKGRGVQARGRTGRLHLHVHNSQPAHILSLLSTSGSTAEPHHVCLVR